MSAYNRVLDHALHIRTLQSVNDLLSWDQDTMMPPAANEHRTSQKVLLSKIIHDKKLDPTFFANLEELLSHFKDKASDEAIIIKRLYHDTKKAHKLPPEFVEEMTRATSNGIEAWKQAKNLDQWDLFLPHFEKIITLARKKADFWGYEEHPYDALLDEFEPEMTTAKISSFFSSFKPKLIALLEEIKKTSFFGGEYKSYSIPEQEHIKTCKKLTTLIGLDWEKARMDTSAHPFSISTHPTDSRFTIRETFDDLLNQILAALHEAGHTMYDLGLQQKYYGTALAEPASFSIHESQSRFWETLIGKSKLFVPHIFSALPQSTPYKSEEELYKHLNLVSCSPIRTEADEVTYPLHVILRFEIERELITGSLSPKDLPERWNAGMKDLLGIVPKNNSEGCLQDIHWSLGLFGYFPTYTLGSLFAICWFLAMKKALPNLEELIKRGDFAPIRAFLQEHVWNQGRRLSSYDLVSRSLGREPIEDDYLSYLREKYVG